MKKVESRGFIPAGFRCTQCGRLDAQSNQPCTEHGDVEVVYRMVEAATPVEQPALWSAFCSTCQGSRVVDTFDQAQQMRRDHLREMQGHDVRVISIPHD